MKPQQLPEDSLLSGLDSLRLHNERSNLLRVQMTQETPITRFNPAGQLYIKVKILQHRLKRIVVRALPWRRFNQHIAQQRRMSRLPFSRYCISTMDRIFVGYSCRVNGRKQTALVRNRKACGDLFLANRNGPCIYTKGRTRRE